MNRPRLFDHIVDWSTNEFDQREQRDAHQKAELAANLRDKARERSNSEFLVVFHLNSTIRIPLSLLQEGSGVGV